MNRRLTLIVCLLVMPVVSVYAQRDNTAPKPTEPWSPKPVPRELMDRVINGNLFVPDLRREPRVEPPPGESDETTQPEVAPPVAVTPENPDRRFRLIGTSSETGFWLAFIENTETREIHRVPVDGSVASGAVSLIDYNRIEYEADGQSTSVLIGRDLTGEMPQPPLNDRLDNLFMPESNAASSDDSSRADDDRPSSSESSSNSDPSATPSDADAQRAEILRRLRERRERQSQ